MDGSRASLDELAWLVLLIVAGGMVTGLLAGLFGIGGGGIIVRSSTRCSGRSECPRTCGCRLCVGTSIVIIVPTKRPLVPGASPQGAVMMDVVRVWAIPAVLGVAAGAVVAAFAPGTVLKIAFVAVASTISASFCSAAQLAAGGAAARPHRDDGLWLPGAGSPHP